MQARAVAALREQKLQRKDLAKRIGRSPSAVGKALSAKPACNSDTLRDIFNYLFPAPETALRQHARELTLRAPETAVLLSAVFRDMADLLSGQGPLKPGMPGK
jgi:hypothetical protein